MTHDNPSKEDYPGDGLFVSDDGYQTCLRAERLGSDHLVYLDDNVVRNLLDFIVRQSKGKFTYAFNTSNQSSSKVPPSSCGND